MMGNIDALHQLLEAKEREPTLAFGVRVSALVKKEGWMASYVHADLSAVDAEMDALLWKRLEKKLAELTTEVAALDCDNLLAKVAPAPVAAPVAPSFKIGDEVQLNSGGPDMTILVIKPNSDLVCQWTDGDGQMGQTLLPQACVKLVKANG